MYDVEASVVPHSIEQLPQDTPPAHIQVSITTRKSTRRAEERSHFFLSKPVIDLLTNTVSTASQVIEYT